MCEITFSRWLVFESCETKLDKVVRHDQTNKCIRGLFFKKMWFVHYIGSKLLLNKKKKR